MRKLVPETAPQAARRKRRVDPSALDQVEALGREVYGDGFEAFLETPRRSLAGETPAALIGRGELAPVIAVITKAATSDFG